MNLGETDFRALKINRFAHSQVIEKLGTAFQLDLENFLKSFEVGEEMRYADFFKVWKHSSLRDIFVSSKSTFFSLYTDLCIFTIKKFFMFSTSGHIQVGAIYLLYTLYRSNFFGNNFRIRLTVQEHSTLEALAKDFSEKYLLIDVGYSFYFLQIKEVFKICLFSLPYQLEAQFMFASREFKNDLFLNEFSLDSLPDTLFQLDTNANLNTLKEITEEYEQSYQAVLNDNETKSSYTVFQPSDLLSKIQAELSAIQEVLDEDSDDDAELTLRDYIHKNPKVGRRNKLKQEALLKQEPEQNVSISD